jgi:hypothetical protein
MLNLQLKKHSLTKTKPGANSGLLQAGVEVSKESEEQVIKYKAD